MSSQCQIILVFICELKGLVLEVSTYEILAVWFGVFAIVHVKCSAIELSAYNLFFLNW